ncbi:MAG: hypothetical protein TREMPRED_000180 [Tremellales sp. Tagirdzhanova-0007]|nr:MAG: hypothetical protein TREMPRED_000180 [Tremellales sp. Tagirdzhanova-0007]
MPAVSFLPFLQTVPFATRILTLTLLFFTLSALFLSLLIAQVSPPPPLPGQNLPWLVMIPSESYRYPWTLVTAGWVELSVVEMGISLVSLPLACRYLERVWGARELFRFSMIVVVASNIIAFGFSWLMYLGLGQEDALYGLPYHGLSGLQVGFLVAFTQLIPEHQLQLFGALKLRVKTLPGIYLLLSNVLVLLFGSSPYMLVQFGFYVAWAYLRFFKASENGEFRGDRSETFAFQYWFPPPVRPYIAAAGNHVYKVCVRFGLVQAWDEPTGYNVLPGPGQARAEAERRRALALKALDARIASGSPAPGNLGSPASAGGGGVMSMPAVSPPAASTTAPSSSPKSQSTSSLKGTPAVSAEEAGDGNQGMD